MRILMTLDAVGGIWRYAMDLGAGLAGRGHDVIYAGLGPPPSPDQRTEAGAIGRLIWGEAPLEWMAQEPGDLATVAPWLAGLIREHRPDLVHLNLPSQAVGLPPEPPAVVVCHSCPATWYHAVLDQPLPGPQQWLGALIRQGIAGATLALAPTAAHARLTEAVHDVTGIQVLPNASAAPPRPPSAGNGTTIAVARWWDDGKNGAALDAAAQPAGAPVVMIGACTGGSGQRFTARNATTLGALPHEATMARIGAASLFVSPSLYEPFGLAALEAARAGRPLLLADIPVYREIWDGAARFFPPRDPAALANAIRDLLGDSPARLRLGAAAAGRARDFTPAAQLDATEAVYRLALSKG